MSSKGPKSKYKGVCVRVYGNRRFVSQVTHKGVIYSCGNWPTELEAVKARDMTIIKLNLPVKTQIIKKKQDEQKTP